MKYRGRKTAQISFPLGGIGSGCMGLAGNGSFQDMEIGNEPNKDSSGDFTHFAVKAENADGVVDARVLMGDLQPPYVGHTGRPMYSGYGFGPDRGSMAGIPHFAQSCFEGEFPVATLHFADSHFPGRAVLTAFNPFIPTNEDDSSLPAAFFMVELENTTKEPLDYTVALSTKNFYTDYRARHSYHQSDHEKYLYLSSTEERSSTQYGDLTLCTDAEEASFQEYWFRGNWFDSLSVFWKDFCTAGRLKNRHYTGEKKSVNQMATHDFATLAAHVRLAPGQKKTVRFVLSWSNPLRANTWEITAPGLSREEIARIRAQTWKNFYATQFVTSQETALYAIRQFDRLWQGTLLFKKALMSSTLPPEVKDAVSANLAVLKSSACMRLEDGSFYAFEGTHPHEGSCEGTCTHVWSYAYALAYLFPRLEQSARTLEYTCSMQPNGGMGFRVQLPPGQKPTAFRACIDGQFGTVIRVLREYRLSGNREWLRKIWPSVRRSIEFAWSDANPDKWDANRDGLAEGRQHHTLDMELFGENAWLSGLYLTGLKAGAELANIVGEKACAAEYEEIWRKGCKKLNVELWNGEYFIQKIDLENKALLANFASGKSLQGESVFDAYWDEESGQIKYQIGEGCGIDQVLGQWHADLLGLPRTFAADKTRAALKAIYRYNYIPVLREHANPCRIFGLNDEAGTVICQYPKKAVKPAIPVPYCEETMHGFEYEVASHMLYYGMECEALTCVRAVRDRYDGERRNPWNEMECGSNYARSLASYALLLAYSGYRCDAASGLVSFAPLNNRNGRWFFSQESGFGTIQYTDNFAKLRVLYGTLTVKTLLLHRPCSGTVRLSSKPIGAVQIPDGIALSADAKLTAGNTLRVDFAAN